MLDKAIKLVMDHENVPDQQHDQFQMLYSCIENQVEFLRATVRQEIGL